MFLYAIGLAHAEVYVYIYVFVFLFSESTTIRHLSVYLGKSAINATDADKEQRFTVEKVIIHQKYNLDNYDNDIGTQTRIVCVCACV